MRVSTTSDDIPEPLGELPTWTSQNPVDPERMLRPVWDQWGLNEKTWVPEVVKKIKTQGATFYSPHHSFDMNAYLATLTESDVKNAVHTYWLTLSGKWKFARKTADERDSVAISKRRKGRQNNVSNSLST